MFCNVLLRLRSSDGATFSIGVPVRNWVGGRCLDLAGALTGEGEDWWGFDSTSGLRQRELDLLLCLAGGVWSVIASNVETSG